MLKCDYQKLKSDYQKLKKAFESNCESITICLTFTDLHGEDDIAITKSQLDRLVKAYEAKKGTTVKMSRTQLAYNTKIGWFLPILAGLIPFLTGTVLPALCVGNSLHLKKGDHVRQIETDGRGLYLGPTSSKGFETVGMVFTWSNMVGCMTAKG